MALRHQAEPQGTPCHPRHLLHGLSGGLLITVLKLTEYRFLILEHSVELYGGLMAAIFAAWASGGIDVDTKEGTTSARSCPVRTGPAAHQQTGNHSSRTRDPWLHGRWTEQPRNRRASS